MFKFVAALGLLGWVAAQRTEEAKKSSKERVDLRSIDQFLSSIEFEDIHINVSANKSDNFVFPAPKHGEDDEDGNFVYKNNLNVRYLISGDHQITSFRFTFWRVETGYDFVFANIPNGHTILNITEGGYDFVEDERVYNLMTGAEDGDVTDPEEWVINVAGDFDITIITDYMGRYQGFTLSWTHHDEFNPCNSVCPNAECENVWHQDEQAYIPLCQEPDTTIPIETTPPVETVPEPNTSIIPESEDKKEYAEPSSKCEEGHLVVSIPHPDETTASLLYLKSGTCNEDNYQGRISYNREKKCAEVYIPIDHCNLRQELYGTPVTSRAVGLYQPTANVTLGNTLEGGLSVVFKSLMVAAECGSRTTYKASFDYNVETGEQDQDCYEIDGHCVFPSYEDDVRFEITEFTDNTFEEEVTEGNRQKIAGEIIYLSLRAHDLGVNQTFAVTECTVTTDDDTEIMLMNPGLIPTDEQLEQGLEPTCGLDAIGLHGGYKGPNFNFQHVLFHLNGANEDGESSFKLTCVAEICDKLDVESKCWMAKMPCTGSSLHVNGKNQQTQEPAEAPEPGFDVFDP